MQRKQFLIYIIFLNNYHFLFAANKQYESGFEIYSLEFYEIPNILRVDGQNKLSNGLLFDFFPNVFSCLTKTKFLPFDLNSF